MKKSVNAMLEGIREFLETKPEGKVQAEGVGKVDALVKKLKKRKDIKDPEALAAWIGRKKYGKSRFSKMGEGVDVPDLLVFEDIEDVLSFVEGLENLLGEEAELEEVLNPLDHASMGAYRRASPTDAPKAYKRVQTAAKAYLDHLKGNEEVELRRKFIFAANALKKSIEDSHGGESPRAMPGTLGIWKAIKTDVSSKLMTGLLQSLLKSDEMKIGSMRVRA